MIEWIVVGAAVAGAALFLAWRVWRSLRRGGCGSDCSCGTKEVGEKFRV
jgi:hypothetical protein